MFTRPNIAGFLQGLFVLPLCALFGGLVALLFRWHGTAAFVSAAVCALFPMAGALKTRQWALFSGLCAGIIAAIGLFAALAPAHAQAGARPLAGFVICIDPGHSSETSQGTASRDGKLTELHVNWIVAQRLEALLAAGGATVVPTKTRESQVVPNRRRAEIANAAGARLFLRLHCDSGEQSGLATYYPDRTGTRFGVTGPSRAVMEGSRRAAEIFQPAVIAALHGSLRDAGIKGDSQTGIGSKQGALTGSIFSHVPALTVEMCVLTNAHDYKFIRTQSGQEQMAEALLAGVEAYAATGRTSENPPSSHSDSLLCHARSADQRAKAATLPILQVDLGNEAGGYGYEPLEALSSAIDRHPGNRFIQVTWADIFGSLSTTITVMYDRQHRTVKYYCYGGHNAAGNPADRVYAHYLYTGATETRMRQAVEYEKSHYQGTKSRYGQGPYPDAIKKAPTFRSAGTQGSYYDSLLLFGCHRMRLP